MRLIEKKCPNCGASLSFNDNDKSCKCEYCKRAFEIERDNNTDYNSLSDQFHLSELNTPLKFAGLYFVGTYVVGAIVTVIAFIIIGFAGYNIFKAANNQLKKNDSSSIIDVTDNEKNSTKYIVSVDDISNNDYENIDTDANTTIIHSGEGVNDARHSYMRDGDPKREKIYVASKDDNNVIVSIYKVNYKDFFHQDDHHTIYVPITYENIKKSDGISNFNNPQVKAPEYYFNSDNSSYAYGYGSFEDAYNNVVKVLETNYKISEK